MGITNLIRKRTVFLKTGDATKYLNIRSQEISGQPLNLTGEKVRELAKSNKLKHEKTSETGNFLFKTSWLEKYLQSEYGSAYTSSVFKSRFSEFDTNQNVQGSLHEGSESVGVATPSDLSVNQKAGVLHSMMPANGDLLTRIKNSPPLIYLSALIVGFVAGAGTSVADRLIEFGYFSDRVSVETPISDEAAAKIVDAIGRHGPETALGKRVRALEASNRGPFKPVEKELRIHLLDPTDVIIDPDYHDFVIKNAAVVCSSSEILNTKIYIKARNIKLENQSPQGLGEFDVFLKHKRVCEYNDSDMRIETIVVNRQSFDQNFNIDTANKDYIDVVALVDNG